jgi:tetraacyldisaccharide 4'-kinase
MATEKARQLLARLAVTPDAAVPDLPFLHRALLLPLLSAASVLLRLPILLSSSALRPRRTLPVPVVSVGNLTWGGNGKTPMVDFLARRFHNIGISPLILTRVNHTPNAACLLAALHRIIRMPHE